jgi:molybdate transport system substrate-binding protein
LYCAEPKPTCEIVVAAASDLSSLEKQLVTAFPSCRVRFTFGSSGMFTQQIKNGAPFDVFLSASSSYIRDLANSGKVVGNPQIYAYGRLALWSKTGLTWVDIAGPKVRHIAIGNPGHAPYGVAAKEALEKQGLWEKVRDKIVYAESVRQALQFAETGNAEICLTAWSLVKDHGGVLVDETWHAPIEQSGAVLTNGKNAEAGKRFLDFLSSDAGRAILAAHGFSFKK